MWRGKPEDRAKLRGYKERRKLICKLKGRMAYWIQSNGVRGLTLDRRRGTFSIEFKGRHNDGFGGEYIFVNRSLFIQQFLNACRVFQC